MEIILLERVEKLGLMGDVVTVKDGFARNFLLPQKKALRATKANKEVFESQRKDIEANNLKAKSEAEAVAKKMEGTIVVLLGQAGETGQLYGSVAGRDIAAGLTEAGFKTHRNQVTLHNPIKVLGMHDVKVRLHAEVFITVVANVARSDEEASLQSEKGGAVSAEEVFESKELAQAADDAETDAAVSDAATDEAAAELEALKAKQAEENAAAKAAGDAGEGGLVSEEETSEDAPEASKE
jgi:large subunit ribosomal protein L9